MVRLQRRTTLLGAALIAFSLAAGAFGFAWYVASGMTQLGAGDAGGAQPVIEYGFVWGQVYLAALVAGLALLCFAAPGTRIRCLVALVLAAVVAPPAALLVVALVGA